MERSLPQIIIMLVIVLAILGTSLFYIGRKLFKWLCLILPNINPKLFIIIPAIIAVSYILAFFPISPGIKKYLVWFNFCFIGVSLYFLLLFFLSDVVLLIGKLTKLIPSPVPQNIIMLIGCIVVVCVTSITAYGIYNGKQLRQAAYTVEIKKEVGTGTYWHPVLENLNIVLIADTHLGHLNSEKWLAKIVDNINAMNPDVVAIAGDIFNDNFNAVQNPEESIRILRNIRSTYGVYACLGNHDGGSTYGEMLRFLEQGNVIVLQDEYAVIEDKFIILGRTEVSPIGGQSIGDIKIRRKEISEILTDIDSNAQIRSLPIIVIDHNPVNIKDHIEDNVYLFLAGHTHKGQLFPANIITDLMFKEINYGYSKNANGPHAVVTSGAGLWGPPLRIGTNNEVVKINVRFIND